MLQQKIKKPKLSICITNYNYGRYLRGFIPTILDQTFTDFELIIVDNCSDDDSVEVIKLFSDTRIKFFINKKNIGMAGNFKKTRAKAIGKYVWLVNADDTVGSKRFLEDMIAAIENEGADIVFAKAIWTQVQTGKRDERRPFNTKKRVLSHKDALMALSTNFGYLPMIGSYIYKNYDIEINDKLKYLADVEYFFRILVEFKPKIVYCDRAEFVFRLHGKNNGLPKETGELWKTFEMIVTEEVYTKINNYSDQSYAKTLLRRFRASHLIYGIFHQYLQVGISRELFSRIGFLISKYSISDIPNIVIMFCEIFPDYLMRHMEKRIK